MNHFVTREILWRAQLFANIVLLKCYSMTGFSRNKVKVVDIKDFSRSVVFRILMKTLNSENTMMGRYSLHKKWILSLAASYHLMTYRGKAVVYLNKPHPRTSPPAGRHVSNLFLSLFTYKSFVLVHKRVVAWSMIRQAVACVFDPTRTWWDKLQLELP